MKATTVKLSEIAAHGGRLDPEYYLALRERQQRLLKGELEHPEDVVERGAETIRLPDGSGYSTTVCDYPTDGVRHITLMAVSADDEHTELHTRYELLEPTAAS